MFGIPKKDKKGMWEVGDFWMLITFLIRTPHYLKPIPDFGITWSMVIGISTGPQNGLLCKSFMPKDIRVCMISNDLRNI